MGSSTTLEFTNLPAQGSAVSRDGLTGEIIEALRGIAQLDGLTPEEYCWLAINGTQMHYADMDLVFSYQQPADIMTILLEGEIHVRRHQAGPITYFIGRSGQLTGKLPYSRMKSYGGDGYAAGSVWMLNFHESLFQPMLAAIPSMGQRCVGVLLDRVREVTRMEQQSEKLAALGKLAANLSHELNNPASAARSAANSLWTELREYGDQKFRLGALCFDEATKASYGEWVQKMRSLLLVGDALRPDIADLDLAGREDEFSTWLGAHGIAEGWKIAPTLAELRIEVAHLDELAAMLPTQALPTALMAVSSAIKSERMTDAVIDSTRRIFEIISAIKDYSYMDQAPIQEVNLPQAIDSALAMLNSRLSNVDVVRDYDPATPSILAYGSELNQVWTVILENALDAMDELPVGAERSLRIRSSVSGAMVVIEFWDNGPGIAPEIESRIFEPFFTTKAVGSALGLGLDVANRVVLKHRGQILVQSTPEHTCFEVRLPIEQVGAY